MNKAQTGSNVFAAPDPKRSAKNVRSYEQSLVNHVLFPFVTIDISSNQKIHSLKENKVAEMC